MLNHNAPVVAGGLIQTGFQFLAVVAFANAHAGAEIGRFGEDRVNQNGLDLLDDFVRPFAPIATLHQQPGQHGQAIGYHYMLEDRFVHAHRRTNHTSAHVGQVGQLQQTLYRAILAIWPVQHRENNVELGNGRNPHVLTFI